MYLAALQKYSRRESIAEYPIKKSLQPADSCVYYFLWRHTGRQSALYSSKDLQSWPCKSLMHTLRSHRSLHLLCSVRCHGLCLVANVRRANKKHQHYQCKSDWHTQSYSGLDILNNKKQCSFLSDLPCLIVVHRWKCHLAHKCNSLFYNSRHPSYWVHWLIQTHRFEFLLLVRCNMCTLK